MGKQSEAFLRGAGDDWYERCKDIPRFPDPVIEAINHCEIKPTSVVEFGCGDGWRLNAIKKLFECRCYGLELSEKAVTAAHRTYADITVQHRYAILPDDEVDMVIFGFCLYVFDREDLFGAVGMTDAVITDGGHIIVHDFFPDYPHKRRYHHQAGLWSYKMDYSKLWLGNPAYRLEHCSIIGNDDDRTGVAVLKKDLSKAYPEKVL